MCEVLFHNYHRRSDNAHNYTIKIDLRKVYNSVRWSFILKIIKVMGFSNIMIRWIKASIFSPRYSINLNGDLGGFLGGLKGLKRGDPLSLYIFVMAIEALLRLLNKSALNSNFRHHKGCNF